MHQHSLSATQRAVLEQRLRHALDNTTRKQVLPRRPNQKELPLSFAQQRLWFLEQLAEGAPLYHIPCAFRLHGPLDAALLESSLNVLVERHEALRTIFPSTASGDPTQVIMPALSLPLPVIDLEPVPAAEQEREIQQSMEHEVQRPFDVKQGPLIRALLLRQSAEEHIFLLTLHHMIADGWSVGILLQELGTCYRVALSKQPAALPEVPLQYADFTLWQREQQASEQSKAHVDYWRKYLDEAPATLELPTESARPAKQTFRGKHQVFQLPGELSAALEALCRQEQVTLFTALLAAFQTLLYRYSGQEDFFIGFPVAGRQRTEFEGLIGCCINTLVLRAEITGTATFRQLLARTRAAALEAQQHQDLPFEHVVELVQPERTLSHNPLFQVMFAFQNTPQAALDLPGIQARWLDVETGTARLDLTLSMEERDGQLNGAWEYSTDLFTEETILRMGAHFQRLLEVFVADAGTLLAAAPLLTPAEQRLLLEEWNVPPPSSFKEACIQELFEAQVEQTPGACALRWEAQSLTYRELNEQANQLAHYLQKQGVRPDDLIGLAVERSAALIVGLLGILKAGGAYLPLDPDYPPERLAFMLRDAQPRFILTQEALRSRFSAQSVRLVCLDTAWGSIASQPETNPPNRATPRNLAYCIYTSGSTGKPKGVLIEHRGVCDLAHAQAQLFQLPPSSRVLQFASLNFDASLWEMLMALLSGATLCLGTREQLLPGNAFTRYLQEQAITVATLTPSVLAVLPPEELPALQTVISAGEACSAEVASRWAAGGRQFYNAYGPTEITICATVGRHTEDAQKPHLGRPIARTEVYVLDRQGNPVPVGIPGELYIGGNGLARGYLNRPELTAERFIPHSWSPIPGARLYRTGDLVRFRPNGVLEFLGRCDEQVKLRGFRIEPGEIEAVLNQHPQVRESVVIVVEGSSGDKSLVACFIPEQFPGPASQELRRYAKNSLPEYMVPNLFSPVEAFPITPHGKIDRQALRQRQMGRTQAPSVFIGARDAVELQLAAFFEEALHVHPISVTDDFFTLGGHSLLALRLMAQIQHRFGVDLPLSTLFQSATIEDLAQTIRQNPGGGLHASLVGIQPFGTKRPFYCLHPVGGNVLGYMPLARHLGRDQPFYAFQSPGLAGEQEPYRRIEDMAEHYIGELRRFQPQGPYLLGGSSFGGLVAFEMAVRLYLVGEEIAMLAIFDTPAPRQRTNGPSEDDATWLAAYAQRMVQRFAREDTGQRLPVLLSEEALRQRSPEQQREYILEVARAVNVVPPDAGIEHIRRTLTIWKINAEAGRNYLPQGKYPLRMTLFRASGDMDEGDLIDPRLGWDTYLSEPIEIHTVPGTHEMMIYEPHVVELARQLKDCLEIQHHEYP